MTLLEPGTQSVHVAAGRSLADTEHLTVVEKLARRSVSQKFEQKAAPSPFAVRGVRIGLVAHTFSESRNILLASLYVDAFSFMGLQAQMILSDTQLQVFEFPLHRSFADAQFICDLLFPDRLLPVQQDPEDLLNPRCKLHNIPRYPKLLLDSSQRFRSIKKM